MKQTDYSRLINSIEESIEYKNNNQILLKIDDWYLMRTNSPLTTYLSGPNSFGYHRGCQQDLMRITFLHWKTLKCRGCGMLPPDGTAGAWSLHNMEYIQAGEIEC